MALGGGTFVTQNKTLPGSYINFISTSKADSSLSNRGIVAMPLELDWGVENKVFTVTKEDLIANSVKLFGYDISHNSLKGIRDLFRNVHTLYAYRLNGGGVKASNTYATAKYCGVRGNDIKISIQKSVDDETKFIVKTLLDTTVVDEQTVTTSKELTSNDFVDFKEDATLTVVVAEVLTGGTNGTVDGQSHQNFLNKIESYTFNALGVLSTDDTVKDMYISFCKRMRDEVGFKFQTVVHNKPADYEGVINVKNTVIDDVFTQSALVYWVTGIIAGCNVNKSNLNKNYDGEFNVVAGFTQVQLESAINAGEFTLHKVGSEVRVLSDINSLVSVTKEKGSIFKDNQTIRVIDQVANDIAVLFNTKYIGSIPNNKSGRVSLWADIVKHHEELEKIGAIENFSSEDVKVEQGEGKKAIVITDNFSIVNAMEQLYMTVRVN